MDQAGLERISLASTFVNAYNSGDLRSVASLLSTSSQLNDCDYATRRMVTLRGSSAILSHFDAAVSAHDKWTFDYYSEDQMNHLEVVLLPVARQSDVLRDVGLPRGTKRSFKVDFFVLFDAASLHIDLIDWATLVDDPVLQSEICSP